MPPHVVYSSHKGSNAKMSDCEQARATVRAVVGEEPATAKPDADQIRDASLHVNRCKSCRSEISAEERGRFMHGIALGRK
jgi:hypothetical protein